MSRAAIGWIFLAATVYATFRASGLLLAVVVGVILLVVVGLVGMVTNQVRAVERRLELQQKLTFDALDDLSGRMAAIEQRLRPPVTGRVEFH